MKRKKSVALKYPEWAAAPVVAATATGDAVDRMIEIAQENNVPVVQNEAMAQVLSGQKVGTIVPEETWLVLAKIFAFVIERDKSI